MKALVTILIAAAVVYAILHYYFQKMPATDEGTAPTQAISLTGVRMDLLQIAEAERSFIALNAGALHSTSSLLPAICPCRAPGAMATPIRSTALARNSPSGPAINPRPRAPQSAIRI